MNLFVKYYEQHQISPVSQDIDDLDRHFYRREALYRELGLLPSMFEGRNVLEVGPGSGFNSIVTASYKPLRYVLVEPNTTGYKNTVKLLHEHGFDGDHVTVLHKLVEEFQSESKFDVVLCEGMLTGIGNHSEVLAQLDNYTAEGGVVVMTCVDSISYFMDTCRRYLGYLLCEGVESFSEKVELLSKAFASHLEKLAGCSRPLEDWVLDNFLNPAAAAVEFQFPIDKALEIFGDSYYFLGASPGIFNNISWYKELEQEPRDFNLRYRQQYERRAHMLMHYQLPLSERSADENRQLMGLCRRVGEIARDYDQLGAQRSVATEQFEQIQNNIGECSVTAGTIRDIRQLVEDDHLTWEKVANADSFSHAFGRGMQYLSLVKTRSRR